MMVRHIDGPYRPHVSLKMTPPGKLVEIVVLAGMVCNLIISCITGQSCQKLRQALSA
jgi:hypothetical protein